jgi:hypothetical protein
VGLVSQEPTLFQTSILENIALGRPGATEEEVFEAARKANAHKFISVMPAGYNTQVSWHGRGSVTAVNTYARPRHAPLTPGQGCFQKILQSAVSSVS